MKRDTPDPASDDLAASPWDDIDATGSGLSVDNFITTRISQTINALRRTVTFPYAEEAGLTVSEWRVLSYVAFAKKIAFSELVVLSTSDKALVSRAVKLLEQRGLVSTEAHGNTPRKKITVLISAEGEALYDKVMPIARSSQAEMIRVLSLRERRAMYSGLRKLLDLCASKGPIGSESGRGSDG